ncbi:hypothetical protein [Lactiplantibacillus plajomi]|uniref:Lipoprotein n=1 Tax=Lactiplantibacillus plajomi TaxID=1457217 RepID=A0ABV6K235_9LACO|nr:hypothetical protein [Lactiplantibacillus plajomi]
MKKFVKVLSFLGLLGLLVGGLSACGKQAATSKSSDSGYTRSINKGLDAVAENKFDKALTYFDNALTQKPKDRKAKAYRDQTQAYVDTQSQLKDGDVEKAVTTVTTGSKITNGARSLTTKLAALKKTAKADLDEYQQLDKDVTTQLKVTDGQYDEAVIKQCKAIDWDKQPYLKKLKANVNKLLKQADQTDNSSSSSSSATSSSAADTKVSAADHKQAEQMRRNIFKADQGKYVWSELEKVPDSFILKAEKQSEDAGSDVGYTGKIIAKQYPNIKAYTGASTDDPNSPGAKAYLNADEAKQELGALDFYNKNKSRIEITGQEKGNDAWTFTWSFKGGSMGGTFTVENKGIVSATSSNGDDIETANWR